MGMVVVQPVGKGVSGRDMQPRDLCEVLPALL